MDFKRHFSIIFLIIIAALNHYTFAQQPNSSDKNLKYLSDEQRQLLKEQQQLLDKTRTIFKKNLTEKQLAILKNKNLSKEKRTALLKKNLSKKQLDIINTNQNLLRHKKNRFKKSLTKKQKLRLRKFINKRNINDRRRLVRRLRRLIRENMDQ